jgi:hypothetical protein
MTSSTPPSDRAQLDIWEEVSSGQLDRRLHAALRVLAEEREDIARKLAAHTPLDEAFRVRVTEAVAAQLVHEAQRRRFLRLGMPTFMIGAAAAVLLTVVFPSADVPAYDLTVAGGIAETRGTADEHAQVVLATPTSELELVLRPARRVEGELVLSVYLYSSRAAFALQKQAERAPGGAFRLVGSVESLFGAPFGSYTLAATVGREPLSAAEMAEKLGQADEEVEHTRLEYRPVQ